VVKLEIFWDYANDPSIKTVQSNPVPGAVYNHTYPDFFVPATKTVTIRVVAYSGINCLNASTQTITLKASPQIQFDTVPPVCADASAFSITQASILNGLPGNGVFSGPGVSPTGTFDPTTAGPGTHTIRYTFNSTNGCSGFSERTIRVFPLPTANAGPDLLVLEGTSVTIQGSATGTGLSYLWTPSTFLDNATLLKPTVTPIDELMYSLKVTSSDGCVATDNLLVKVLKVPVIPNTFSPNNDGIHDRWEIKYLATYPGATVEVYNRYGQVVYKATGGYGNPWNGNFKGSPLPAGTYYYIINPKNGRKQIAGFVDIIR
jgi:gliding motility-associated-like protein